MKIRYLLFVALGLGLASVGLGGQAFGSGISAHAAVVSPRLDPPTDSSIVLSTPDIARDGSGNLTFSSDVTVSGWEGSGDVCQATYGCYMALDATLASGGTEQLQGFTVYGGGWSPDPWSLPFSGTVASAAIVSVSAYVSSSAAPDLTLSSGTYAVVDPDAPQAISLSVTGVSRDASTGDLEFTAAATASNWSQPGSVCDATYGCDFEVDGTEADGTVVSLGSEAPSGGTYGTASLEFDAHGPTWVPQIVSMQAWMNNSGGAKLYSNVVSVPDPYVTKSASVKIASIAPDVEGGLDVKAIAISTGFGMPDGPCPDYYCHFYLQAHTSTGVVDYYDDPVEGGSLATYPQNVDLYAWVHADDVASITGWSVEITESGTTNAPLDSSVFPFTQGPELSGETRAGGSKAENWCPCNGADPVDLATGEFYKTETDLSLPGVGPALGVTRSYSSTSASSDSAFGYGWASNLDSQLVVITAGDSSDPLPEDVQVVQENGATAEFTRNSDDTYSPPVRVHATLAWDSSTSTWTFVRKAQETMVFGSDGNILSDADLNGNSITYHYTSGVLSSISGSGGRSISIAWTGSHITGLTDSAGRTVSYGYTSGNLTSVTAVDSSVTTYAYNSGHDMTSFSTPDGNTTTNTYDGDDRVVSQSDPLGRATTFAYDGDTTTTTAPNGDVTVDTYFENLLTSETVASGTALAATTIYGYDPEGNRDSITDPLGHTVSSNYDNDGNQLTSTDALGNTTTSTYDALDDVTSVTDPLSRETTFTYDSDGNKLSETSPSGRIQHWTYNTDGTVATSEDARGKSTTYTYNSAGDPTSSTDPDSRTKSVGYNSAGFATSTTDAAGKVTTMTYDPAGRLLTVTDPNGHTTTKTYDGDGNLLTTEDADSHTMSNVYDADGEVTSSTDARGKTTTSTYTDAGQLATTTNPDSAVTTNTYNLLGELTSVEDANSHTTSYSYDADGRKLTTTLPSGDVSSTAYDAAGRPTSTTDAKGKVTTTAYNADGEPTSVTDPLSQVTATSYTADGQVHVVTLPDSSAETYAYNADGQTTEFTNADGKNTTYSYDDADLMIGKIEPGSIETDYSYDSAGRLHVTTNPDGSTLTDTYDDAGQLTREHSSVTGSTDITFTYDAAGQRATMTDETGTTTYSYNADGQVSSVTDGASATVGYGYDNAGLMTSIVYPGSHTVAYGYDPVGQMTSLTDWSSNETTFAWTADGQLATQTDPGGVVETRSYDADDQATGIADIQSGSGLADYTYGYDDAGDITSDGTTDPIGTTAHTYNYTANSQLTTVSSGGTSAAYGVTSGGELTSDTAGDTLAYNSAQELTSLTPTTGPTTSYTYDDNGSRTSSTIAAHDTTAAATTSYAFDAEQNLASVTLSGATSPSVTYTSDGDGLRQTRTTGTTTTDFLWDVSGSLPLLLDDGTDSYLYGPSSAPIAQIADSGGAIQYLHGDLVGSTRLITDSTGNVVGTTEYDAYGNRTNHAGTADSAVGYTGNWTDPTTGLTYLRARDYDAATAQFLTADPAIDQTHLPYAYTPDDPLSDTDSAGLDSNPVTTWLQNLAPIITPLPGAYSHYLDDLNSTHDFLYSFADSFDPIYHAINGWYNTGDAIANHCSFESIASNAEDAIGGTLGTGAIIAGGLSGAPVEGGASGDGVEAPAPSEASQPSTSITVGRWMSQTELGAMRASGVVQEGSGGVTNLASPADPAAYGGQARPGSTYVEFEVPSDTLSPGGAPGWATIRGPNSWWAKYGKALPEMPAASNIREMESK